MRWKQDLCVFLSFLKKLNLTPPLFCQERRAEEAMKTLSSEKKAIGKVIHFKGWFNSEREKGLTTSPESYWRTPWPCRWSKWVGLHFCRKRRLWHLPITSLLLKSEEQILIFNNGYSRQKKKKKDIPTNISARELLSWSCQKDQDSLLAWNLCAFPGTAILPGPQVSKWVILFILL